MIVSMRNSYLSGLLFEKVRKEEAYKHLDDGDLQCACVEYVQSTYKGNFRDFAREFMWEAE